MIMKILKTILTIVLFPVFVVFFVVFLLVWGVLTISGIGPLLQYLCNLSDKNTLDREKMIRNCSGNSMRLVNVPSGLHSCHSASYNVFAIYMQPSTPSPYPPVCIPNGLGATAVLIAQMQEHLVARGFRVLSYDRLGVGLSDINTSKRSPSALDVVREMDYVMEQTLPNERWILLGPSMGSIVAQCYTSLHADKVVGLLNMDGLPYPFLKFRSSFMWAAFIYRVYASIIWTGVLRPFIGSALQGMAKIFASESFPLAVAIAQMNQTNFFANVGLEMGTMMDCCELAEAAWGAQSLLRLPADHLDNLVRASPNISIDFDDEKDGGGRKVTTLRSESELGKDWAPEESVSQTVQFLREIAQQKPTPTTSSSASGAVSNNDKKQSEIQKPLLSEEPAAVSTIAGYRAAASLQGSMLSDVWGRLVVRVMSGRNHDFGNAMANSFYTPEVKMWTLLIFILFFSGMGMCSCSLFVLAYCYCCNKFFPMLLLTDAPIRCRRTRKTCTSCTRWVPHELSTHHPQCHVLENGRHRAQHPRDRRGHQSAPHSTAVKAVITIPFFYVFFLFHNQ